jgi:hypothetical protein
MTSILVAAAVAGIALGTQSAPVHPDLEPQNPPAEPRGDKNDCRGKNECKGKGGCKTDKHACKGKNECKGQGGCRSNMSASLRARLLASASY